MKSTIAVIIFSVCFVTMFGSSVSIKCYSCDNSIYCPNPKCGTIEKDQSEFLVNCDEGSIKCGVFRTVDADGENVIITHRTCLSAFDEHYCSYLSSSPLLCTSCFDDGCNNS